MSMEMIIHAGLSVMDLDDPVLFLHERKCRVCGKTYSLTEGFYLTRKMG